MRLNDGSLCTQCKHFEHECDLENGCMEIRASPSKLIKDRFWEAEESIKQCDGFVSCPIR